MGPRTTKRLSKPSGSYTVRANLGGTGVDSARDGQIFPVRIHIPEQQNIDFQLNSGYKNVKSYRSGSSYQLRFTSAVLGPDNRLMLIQSDRG
jgi:hypothetical protein